MSRVLIIADPHEPYTHPKYIDHCRYIRSKYKTDKTIHIGDEVDNHSISYHEHDPNGLSPSSEMAKAKERMGLWYKHFPRVMVCVSNHGSLIYRKVKTAGLPREVVKDYRELWGAPDTWEWGQEWNIDDVEYIHGEGYSGKYAYANCSMKSRVNTVLGHLHSVCGIHWSGSSRDRLFGMSVGCGIDRHAYAFAYGKHAAVKPFLACGVVIDGKLPIVCPMEM